MIIPDTAIKSKGKILKNGFLKGIFRLLVLPTLKMQCCSLTIIQIKMLDYMDELTKLWDDALVEAAENRQKVKNTETKQNQRLLTGY